MADRPGAERRPFPFFLAVGGLLVAFILLALSGVFLWQRGADDAGIGGPFKLVNGDGRTVTDRDFRGKYMLVYFGYTFCPDVCPTTLNEVAGALDQLGAKADRIQPVFISVDPKRDTPPVVKEYAAAFSPRLTGLTGDEASIAAAAKEYRVYVALRRTGPGPTDYTVDHSSILYLMGPDGRFVAPIAADQPAEKLAADLNRLVP